jgi:hypothetical protein
VKRVAVAAMIVAAGLLVASPAAAHPAPFSYVDLRISAQAVDAAFVLHVFDLGHGLEVDPADQFLDPAFATARLPGLAALITSRLQLIAAGRALTASVIGVEPVPDRHAVRVTLRYSVSALPGSVTLSGVMFPYDPEHQTFINVYEGEALTQAMIDSRRTRFEYFSGSPQGRSAVVATFLPAGAHHILIGPDHILFLVGLLLLGGTWRRLALIVTGFTVAHSVTLTLATLCFMSLICRTFGRCGPACQSVPIAASMGAHAVPKRRPPGDCRRPTYTGVPALEAAGNARRWSRQDAAGTGRHRLDRGDRAG